MFNTGSNQQGTTGAPEKGGPSCKCECGLVSHTIAPRTLAQNIVKAVLAAHRKPTLVLVSLRDYKRLEDDTSTIYVSYRGPFVLKVYGVPVYASPQMAEGEFLVR